ncbi:hypothetical protein [Micromonospora globbae]|jgi:hypothetical protein|uniref:LppX_LprAFG lipoprotein n=1 Tax=Micromonospora globbae TaxID=1894969 RepID=A0ABZ1S7N3_9ACTN|nr:hypothetical protein [Micromonospora globbae]WTF85348.1 hypothetical protein OH732_27330 [Micromonospora globbae]
MKSRRLATTGVALVAALGLGLAGCGNQTDADAPAADGTSAAATTAAAEPRDELLAAAKKLNEQSVRMKLESSAMTASGVLDPKKMAADMTMEVGGQGKFQVVTIGDDTYMKISGLSSGSSDKWMHLDTSALSGGGQLAVITKDDPAGANKLVTGIVDVKRTGDGTFEGTLDYTRSQPNDQDIKALGDKAKAVPFTAKVDGEGRLVEFVIDASVLHASLGKMVTTYSDFGTDVEVKKPPASEVQEAPAELAKILGGGN